MNSLRKTIDAAVILSIITGGLYVVGWSFWWTYFKYFGIRSHQIDLSLYEVIVTTWWISLPLIVFLIFINFFNDYITNLNASKFYFPLIIFLMNNLWNTNKSIFYSFSLLIISAYISIFINTEGVMFIISLSVIFISVFVISIYFAGEFINNDINNKNILLILSLAFIYNIYSGFIFADRVSNGNSGHKISIEHKNKDLSFDNYVFISYMNGVYFIHEPNSERYNFNTLMIHEGNIESAKLSK